MLPVRCAFHAESWTCHVLVTSDLRVIDQQRTAHVWIGDEDRDLPVWINSISSCPKCLCLGMVVPSGSSSVIITNRSEPLFFGLTLKMNGTAAEGWAAFCEGGFRS